MKDTKYFTKYKTQNILKQIIIIILLGRRLFLNILFYFIIFSFSGVGCLITYITNKNNKNIFLKIVEVMIQQSRRPRSGR
jgi:hypothetical protein